MHIRTVTKRNPAPASDIAYVLDVISQILAIVMTVQSILGKE
ncbi:MAG: hypothetical protein QG656_1516 [Candidatus Hydrogenedentes bacterium]|jgi:hypothetical protein|nr:hypothetical protein [Candidatus Hydrogenedentota bacterium]